MNAAAQSRETAIRTDLLLRHCRATEPEIRPSAHARLEALVGNDLARRLVAALASR